VTLESALGSFVFNLESLAFCLEEPTYKVEKSVYDLGDSEFYQSNTSSFAVTHVINLLGCLN
jgi:hypothetical protein